MRSKEALLNSMLNSLSDGYQKTEGFPIYDILATVASGLEVQSGDIEFAANQNNVYQLSGEHLAQFIKERTGIERKKGVAAWGYLQITTNQNVVAPAGSLFATATGLTFKTILDNEINNTTASVYVECTETGLNTNTPANTVNRIAIAIAGVVSVNNAEAFTGGSDEETDDELRARYILHISTPASSGNKYDYKRWALEVEGVVNARVLPLWNGDNTVKVVLIGENNSAPSQSVVAAAQAYIDPNASGKGEGVAPIGAYCTCVAAVQKTVNVATKITVDSGYSSTDVQSAVVANITAFFNELDINATSVSATQVLKAIFETDGVIDCTVPTLNNSSSVEITNTQVAVAGTITVTVGD